MTATGWIVAAAAFAVAAVVFFLLGIRYRKRVAEKEISSAEEERASSTRQLKALRVKSGKRFSKQKKRF